MSALSIQDAEKAWGSVRALAGVSLTVPAGALVAVLGPSGCGKTTLLRCIAGLDRLDGGRIRVDDREVAGPRSHVPTHRRRIALVPQEGALFPHLSVADNVGYGLDRAARRGGRVAEVLALVGLDAHHGRMPHQLSGGQQQRVALARALAPRPSLILLDEPFSALDAGLRAELRRDVRTALRADGATAVLVTHDQAEALSLADEVAVMRDGRVVQMGTPTSVYRTPADPWVAAFVGEAVLLPGTARQGQAETVAGTAPILPDAVADSPTPVTVLIRPEQLHLTVPRQAPPGSVTATVLRRDFHGHDTLTVVRLADGTELAARTLDGDDQHSPGAEVAVRIRDAVLAWPAA
ncbi:ABC transporter ATP-binding protein [Micromonospora sp. NPDC049679]|uniref:ABC transporter ATP-binding protein n=1 Tax=Micromonospora sp. NPDC049679 TaxID=3155920 RepID=UPI0033D0A274